MMTCTSANRLLKLFQIERGCSILLVAQVLQACQSGTSALPESQTTNSACPEPSLSDADAQRAVYVDANAGLDGDGSDSRPYTDLQDGLDAVQTNGVVFVRVGTYQGAFEMEKVGVYLLGQCRDQVFLVGDLTADAAPVLTVEADDVRVQSLTVQDGYPVAAILATGQNAEFSDLRIRDSSSYGLWVSGEAEVVVTGSQVSGNRCNALLQEMLGCAGVKVSGGATGRLIGTTLWDNTGVNIWADLSQVDISESDIWDPMVDEDYGYGYGVYGTDSVLTLGEGTNVSGSVSAGVVVNGGSLMTSGIVSISDTLERLDGWAGVGIASTMIDDAKTNPSIKLLEGVNLERNAAQAFWADELTDSVVMDGVTISEGGSGGGAVPAVEIHAEHAILTNLILTENYHGGIYLESVLGSDAAGAPSSITSSTVDGTQGYGIRISDSIVDIEDVLVSGTTAGPGDLDGIGLFLDSSDINLSDVTCSDNAGFGIVLRDTAFEGKTVFAVNNYGAGVALVGSTGTMDDVHVTGTTASSALGWGGYGIYIGLSDDDSDYALPDEDPAVEIGNGTISSSARAGIAVTDGLHVELSDLIIEGVDIVEDSPQADGVLATANAKVDGADLTITDSVRCALLYDGATGILGGVVTSDNKCGLVQQQCDSVEPLNLAEQDTADITEGVALCGATTYEVVPEDPPAWNNDVDAE